MSRLTPSSRYPSTGHSGGPLPPYEGGGDGGRDGGDSLPDFGLPLHRARLALAVFMTPICMLFLTFTVVYLFRRGFTLGDTAGTGSAIPAWVPVQLPWALLLVNTAILLLSSVTVDLARRAISREAALAPLTHFPGITLGEERRFPWLQITTALGLLFLGGQLIVWHDLSRRGFHMEGGTSSSFIYMLTAMHGIHLSGGIVALLASNVSALLRKPVESRRIVVDITSWYWHLMTALWVYVLVLFAFAAR